MCTARRYFSKGLSIDETFKIALKCAVGKVVDGRYVTYKSAAAALHTVHSCCTQMTVGFRFMENKSNEEKAKLLRDVWLEQGKHADSIVSEFVATDNPKGDESMIIRVHSECFQGLPHAGRVTVGDDVWHAKDRIARRLPRRQLPAKKALKQVFGWITAVGHYKPDSYSMDAWQQLCVEVFQYELEKWREEHRSISIKAKEG